MVYPSIITLVMTWATKGLKALRATRRVAWTVSVARGGAAGVSLSTTAMGLLRREQLDDYNQQYHHHHHADQRDPHTAERHDAGLRRPYTRPVRLGMRLLH